MSIVTVTITVHEQPLDGDKVAYSIQSMGDTLTYDNGEESVDKTFRDGSVQDVGFITAMSDALAPYTFFDFGTGFDRNTFHTELQGSTGKYIVCGNFTTFDGEPAVKLIRLNIDGTKDDTFTPPVFDNIVRKVIWDSVNDKLYCIGGFNAAGYNFIVKLNQNGTIDTSMAPMTFIKNGLGSPILRDIHLHVSGVLFCVGDFNKVNGSNRNGIFAFTSAGSINPPGVSVGTGFGAAGVGFTIDSHTSGAYSGRLVIGGTFTSYNGSACGSIVTINASGTFYAPFNTGNVGFTGPFSTQGRVNKVFIDPDTNKLYVGGEFATYNGQPRTRIIRLSEAGIDESATFITGTGLNDVPFAITKTISGDILIGGQFTKYNGVDCGGLIGLLPTDGSISLSTGHSFTDAVPPTIVRHILANGGVNIITGDFTQVTNDVAVQTQYIVPIGVDMFASAQNLYDNLNIYNILPGVVSYSLVSNQIIVTIDYGGIDAAIVYDDLDACEQPDFCRVEITWVGDNLVRAALLILTQSPYFVVKLFNPGEVDRSEIRLYIYKGDFIADLPATPTRVFRKPIVLTNQSSIYFNVANYLREFCNTNIDVYMLPLAPFSDIPEPISNDEATWIRMEMDTFLGSYDFEDIVGLFEEKYLGIDGYGWVEEGSNPVPSPVFLTADTLDVLRNGHSRVYFVTHNNEMVEVRDSNNPNFVPVPYTANLLLNTEYIKSILIYTATVDWIEYRFTYSGLEFPITKRFNVVDECTHKAVELIFKNKFGVLQTLPFIKKNSNSFAIENKNYNSSILEPDATYNPRLHSVITYLTNGEREITVNTDYVDEQFNLSLKELFHSEEVYLNEGLDSEGEWIITPVLISDKTFNVKTVLNDKLIQYTLRLKQAQTSINKIT